MNFEAAPLKACVMVDNTEFRKKIASILRISSDKVQDNCALTDLVSDSFALVDMVVELQEELSVRLTQENLRDVRTVSDLWAQIEPQLKS
jgi:acyl carrier protein